MDKQKLKQIKFLKQEIDYLSRMAEDSLKPVHDVVKGSSASFPYTSHVIHVKGINEPELSRKLDRINKRISNKARELIQLRAEAIDYIMAIPDSQVRQIFSMRYIDGLTWENISKMFGSCDEAYARKIHDRYLKRSE